MEYKKSKNILLKILDADSLSKEENSAIITAISTLDWFILGKNRVKDITKNIKAKKEKDTEW